MGGSVYLGLYTKHKTIKKKKEKKNFFFHFTGFQADLSHSVLQDNPLIAALGHEGGTVYSLDRDLCDKIFILLVRHGDMQK